MNTDIKEKLLKHFRELITRGEELLMDKDPELWSSEVDRSRYIDWRTQVINLLDRVLPVKGLLRKKVSEFSNFRNTASKANEILFTLSAVENDFRNGMFDDLEKRIEAGVSVNYMEQAEDLIKESSESSRSYIPAAVLAGAVLEKKLKNSLRQKYSADISY